MIIMPTFIWQYNCSEVGLFFKAVSRMLRIFKFEIFLKSKDTEEEKKV